MESRFRELVVDACFPRFCVGCGEEGTLWCSSCASTWWPAPMRAGCPFCGSGVQTHTCRTCRQETYLDGLSAFAPYGNPIVRQALTEWKYVGDRSIETVFIQWLIRFAPSFFALANDAVFTPVPLHSRKRRMRGFDQAGLLADWCGQIFSRPVHDLLIRTRFTESQAHRVQRNLGELDGIFALHPSVHQLPEHVLLCDDVFTSGATMDSAARVLKEAGVKQVWGFVIAKGG